MESKKSMKNGVKAALLTVGLLASTAAPGQAMSEPGDNRIVAAREALRKGDQRALEQLAASTGSHVLDAYVRYWRLVNVLARPEPAPEGELDAFLRAEAGTVLAERLRADWLRRLAKDANGRALSPSTRRCATPITRCAAPPGPHV